MRAPKVYLRFGISEGSAGSAAEGACLAVFCSVAAILIHLIGSTAFAYHPGRSGECNDCHTFEKSNGEASEAATPGTLVANASDAGPNCLTCHPYTSDRNRNASELVARTTGPKRGIFACTRSLAWRETERDRGRDLHNEVASRGQIAPID